MASDHPIGIFDSGVGGLSIARSIHELLPGESLIYVADNRYAPYGEKPQTFIAERCATLVEYLLSRAAKTVVVACNTATVSTIQTLREQFEVPIVGVEPGIKPAVSYSDSGVIGVLVTRQTANSDAFNQLLARFTGSTRILVQPCPGLAQRVEELDLKGPETRTLLASYVMPLLEQGADTLVLGCTHYAFLIPLLEQLVGPEIRIINTQEAVARQVSRRLEASELFCTTPALGKAEFLCTQREESSEKLFGQLWGESVQVGALEI